MKLTDIIKTADDKTDSRFRFGSISNCDGIDIFRVSIDTDEVKDSNYPEAFYRIIPAVVQCAA